MRLEWDEEKNRANRAKHGISFEEASAIFEGPILTAPDNRYDYGEDRFISYGQLGAMVVVVVVHTSRGERIRLISARKANRREREKHIMSISKERLKEIEAIPDEEIDYSDIPEADEEFWRRAELQMPRPKKGVYIRLDADVLDWLKSKGKGYQTRLNAMLRALMASDQQSR